MNKLVYAVLSLIAFASCAESTFESFYIKGSSSVATLDGSKLYLEIFSPDSLLSRDSCEVVHGEFNFTGRMDSAQSMGHLILGESTMPIVIERGDIVVNIDRTGIKVSGSPLNELLYDYLDKQIQLINRGGELGDRQARMLLEGYDEKTIHTQLTAEAQQIEQQMDSLEVTFITHNFDNILGPFAFNLLAQNTISALGYPLITDQMELIMINAPETFKKHPFVASYCKAADDFMARMKGDITDEPADTAADKPADGEATAPEQP